MLHGSIGALDEGVQDWAPIGKTNALRARALERLAEGGGELRIAVYDQEALSPQESALDIGEVSSDLDHPALAGTGCYSGDLIALDLQLDDQKDVVCG